MIDDSEAANAVIERAVSLAAAAGEEQYVLTVSESRGNRLARLSPVPVLVVPVDDGRGRPGRSPPAERHAILYGGSW